MIPQKLIFNLSKSHLTIKVVFICNQIQHNYNNPLLNLHCIKKNSLLHLQKLICFLFLCIFLKKKMLSQVWWPGHGQGLGATGGLCQ